jgi:glutamate-1-semialdehyde 2,1-aminomutase
LLISSNRIGGKSGLFFTEAERVLHVKPETKFKLKRFNRFFHGMLDGGVYLALSAYKADFLSIAHSERDIEATIAATERVPGTLSQTPKTAVLSST